MLTTVYADVREMIARADSEYRELRYAQMTARDLIALQLQADDYGLRMGHLPCRSSTSRQVFSVIFQARRADCAGIRCPIRSSRIPGLLAWNFFLDASLKFAVHVADGQRARSSARNAHFPREIFPFYGPSSSCLVDLRRRQSSS